MNTSTSSIERLQEADRPAVHALLRSHRLPLEGFDDPHVEALVAKNQSVVIGSAAIEICGRYGLLRSLAVADEHRGQDVGTQLTRAAIARARELDLSALYLLTETASRFFPRFGFAVVSREQIPVDVKASVEFTTACPASAQAFHLLLKEEGVEP